PNPSCYLEPRTREAEREVHPQLPIQPRGGAMVNRSVHDQHGNPVPGTDSGGSPSLGPDQVDDALPGLPGWSRRGATLVRAVPVETGSREVLRQSVQKVVGK